MAQDIGSERHGGEIGTDSGGARVRRGRITGRPLERREVRSRDPNLSADTNARLTAELQEAVGATSVEVPRDRPHATEGEPMSGRGTVTMNRIVLAMSFGFVFTVAAIIALLTGSWWVLPLAAAIHAGGTMLVVTLSVRLTRSIEHPSPTLAAAMNEEGVVSADHRFSEMVEEFKSPDADALGQWANVRNVRPQEDPATASFQQSRATVASSQPSASAPDPHAVDLLIATLASAFGAVSVIIPLVVSGSWLWLTPAIVVPLCAGLVAINVLSTARAQVANWWTSRPGIVAVGLGTIVAVAVFCVLVAVFVGQPSGGS